jgi:hypothetical protein
VRHAFVSRTGRRKIISASEIEETIHRTSQIAMEQGYDLKEVALHPEILSLVLKHMHSMTAYSSGSAHKGLGEFRMQTVCGSVLIFANHKQSRDQITFHAEKNGEWVVELTSVGVEEDYVEAPPMFRMDEPEPEPTFIDLLKEIK